MVVLWLKRRQHPRHSYLLRPFWWRKYIPSADWLSPSTGTRNFKSRGSETTNIKEKVSRILKDWKKTFRVRFKSSIKTWGCGSSGILWGWKQQKGRMRFVQNINDDFIFYGMMIISLLNSFFLEQPNYFGFTTPMWFSHVCVYTGRVHSSKMTIRASVARWFSAIISHVIDDRCLLSKTTRAPQTLEFLAAILMWSIHPSYRASSARWNVKYVDTPTCNKVDDIFFVSFIL